MRTRSLLGAALAIGLLLSACGGSDDKKSAEELKVELSDTLQNASNGLPADRADCFADIIVDDIGAEALQDVDLSADEPPKAIQDDLISAASVADEQCGSGDTG
jgi:hypothetical protein